MNKNSIPDPAPQTHKTMQIDYLKELMNSPYPPNMQFQAIEAISETEITHLQQLYNNGNPFPKALQELLFLAGSYCYVLDYGIYDTQEELQEYVRNELEEVDKVITRPFYVIDIYNGNDQFLFIYLDESDDPKVYEGYYYKDVSNWRLVSNSLSKYINALIIRVKEGRNPF